MKKISLFIPSKIYGGTELLMIRLALFLSNSMNVKVYTERSSVAENALNDKFNISLHYDCSESRDELVFLSSKYLLEFIEKSKNADNKYILWQLQPIELISQFLPYVFSISSLFKESLIVRKFLKLVFSTRTKLVKQLIVEMESKNSIFFMDDENVKETSFWLSLDPKRNVIVEPVSLFFNDKKPAPPLRSSGVSKSTAINIVIVSRLSFDFKVYPIQTFVMSLAAHARKNNVFYDLDIIGDGDGLHYLNKIFDEMACEYLSIKFHGVLPSNDVEQRFLLSAHLSVGMGTALLDSSRLSIPTICIDPCNYPVDHEKAQFRWFFESEGYSLGSYESKSNKSLDVMLADFYINSEMLGGQCFEYAKKNHSSEVVFPSIQQRLISANGFNPRVIIDKLMTTSLLQLWLLSKLKKLKNLHS